MATRSSIFPSMNPFEKRCSNLAAPASTWTSATSWCCTPFGKASPSTPPGTNPAPDRLQLRHLAGRKLRHGHVRRAETKISHRAPAAHQPPTRSVLPVQRRPRRIHSPAAPLPRLSRNLRPHLRAAGHRSRIQDHRFSHHRGPGKIARPRPQPLLLKHSARCEITEGPNCARFKTFPSHVVWKHVRRVQSSRLATPVPFSRTDAQKIELDGARAIRHGAHRNVASPHPGGTRHPARCFLLRLLPGRR